MSLSEVRGGKGLQVERVGGTGVLQVGLSGLTVQGGSGIVQYRHNEFGIPVDGCPKAAVVQAKGESPVVVVGLTWEEGVIRGSLWDLRKGGYWEGISLEVSWMWGA